MARAYGPYGLGQHRLVHDRRAIHQPADGANVGPRQRRIVEDARVLRLAVEQLLHQLVAVDAQRFGAAVDVEAVARFVLHLGDEHHFASQGRRTGDPVSLGQHAHHFGVRMLRHHPDELLAIALGHPVLGLDGLVARDARHELLESLRILDCCGGLHHPWNLLEHGIGRLPVRVRRRRGIFGGPSQVTARVFLSVSRVTPRP